MLFSFASGVGQAQVRVRNPWEGLSWDAYGGMAVGLEALLMIGQGICKIRPDIAIVALDVENAFGT